MSIPLKETESKYQPANLFLSPARLVGVENCVPLNLSGQQYSNLYMLHDISPESYVIFINMRLGNI